MESVIASFIDWIREFDPGSISPLNVLKFVHYFAFLGEGFWGSLSIFLLFWPPVVLSLATLFIRRDSRYYLYIWLPAIAWPLSFVLLAFLGGGRGGEGGIALLFVISPLSVALLILLLRWPANRAWSARALGRAILLFLVLAVACGVGSSSAARYAETERKLVREAETRAQDQQILFLVTDIDGKPLEGVQIRKHSYSKASGASQTDAQGRAVINSNSINADDFVFSSPVSPTKVMVELGAVVKKREHDSIMNSQSLKYRWGEMDNQKFNTIMPGGEKLYIPVIMPTQQGLEPDYTRVAIGPILSGFNDATPQVRNVMLTEADLISPDVKQKLAQSGRYYTRVRREGRVRKAGFDEYPEVGVNLSYLPITPEVLDNVFKNIPDITHLSIEETVIGNDEAAFIEAQPSLKHVATGRGGRWMGSSRNAEGKLELGEEIPKRILRWERPNDKEVTDAKLLEQVNSSQIPVGQIFLQRCKVTLEGLHAIGPQPHLWRAELVSMDLTDGVFPFSHFPQMEGLTLRHSNIGPQFFDELNDAKKLKNVWLNSARVDMEVLEKVKAQYPAITFGGLGIRHLNQKLLIQIRDEQGNPVANAKIWEYGKSEMALYSNASGNVVIENNADYQHLVIDSQNEKSACAKVVVKSEFSREHKYYNQTLEYELRERIDGECSEHYGKTQAQYKTEVRSEKYLAVPVLLLPAGGTTLPDYANSKIGPLSEMQYKAAIDDIEKNPPSPEVFPKVSQEKIEKPEQPLPPQTTTKVGTVEFQVGEDELNRALENVPLLMTQARAVPHFKDGKPTGLRFFGIRTGSLFEKMGLKNGDILEAVNGQSVADMTQAMKLFKKLKEERTVNVALVRDSSNYEFKYRIHYGTASDDTERKPPFPETKQEKIEKHELPRPAQTSTKIDTVEYRVEEDELNRALENMPLLRTQARAVPYFKNGRPIGLRLFSIRTGSLFEKMGLKNGDVLKLINGQSVADMTQITKLFEKLKEERTVRVSVERNLSDREFNYQIR